MVSPRAVRSEFMETTPPQWDETVDVIVVGTGAAGLTAAVRAADAGSTVLIIEKSDMVGGTSAVSGGVVWVPMNHHLSEVGIEDSRADAMAYVERFSAQRAADPELLQLCVDRGPEMLRYLEDNTPLRMVAMGKFADYYVGYDVPGKKTGGRSCEPMPFPVGEELPEWADRIQSKVAIRGQAARGMVAEDYGQIIREPGELERRAAVDARTKGSGLVAGLLKGVLDRGIEVRMSTTADSLVGESRSVSGMVVVAADGSRRWIEARRGIVLATGGFEWNRDLVDAFIGYELFPISPQTNTGDGLTMGMEAGALLGNMHSYWGSGAMIDPSATDNGVALPTFDEARAGRGTFIVNGRGKRFVNEAAPYHDFAKAFGAFDPSEAEFPNETAWMIFDAGLRNAKQILSVKPDDPTPAWMPTGDTIEALAERIGVPADSLADSLAVFNGHAAAGADPQFGRPKGMGGSRIGPVDAPPYFAVRIYPGTLGTNGGLRTDADGCVRRGRQCGCKPLRVGLPRRRCDVVDGYDHGVRGRRPCRKTCREICGPTRRWQRSAPGKRDGSVTGPDDRSLSSQFWRRTSASIPAANRRAHIEQALRAYVQSWNENNVAARLALFADDIVIEDPASVVRASGVTELNEFFSAAIPADWSLRFGFQRVVIVGDEAVLTYTVDLSIVGRSSAELLVNSHIVFDGSGLISSMRVFYDAESITER
jgi:3-oxosteroid 1-dehydrogenase